METMVRNLPSENKKSLSYYRASKLVVRTVKKMEQRL